MVSGYISMLYISEAIFSNFSGKYNLYFPGGNIFFRTLSGCVMSVDEVTSQNSLTSFERVLYKIQRKTKIYDM